MSLINIIIIISYRKKIIKIIIKNKIIINKLSLQILFFFINLTYVKIINNPKSHIF